MRGERGLRTRRIASAGRFIPACAGNALILPAKQSTPPVHPRMRGERASNPAKAVRPSGSSPHARGTPRDVDGELVIVRFIPACAGNASRRASRSRNMAVHPRMRGERVGPETIEDSGVGSSPHARGTLDFAQLAPDRRRFIPACAGNAASRRMRTTLQTVHPRMRGERVFSIQQNGHVIGSSPHARGTLWFVRKGDAPDRFIPACAGNASPVTSE